MLRLVLGSWGHRLAEISKETLNPSSDSAVPFDLASPLPSSGIVCQFQFEAVSLSQPRRVCWRRNELCTT